jgi:hypothetical protein
MSYRSQFEASLSLIVCFFVPAAFVARVFAEQTVQAEIESVIITGAPVIEMLPAGSAAPIMAPEDDALPNISVPKPVNAFLQMLPSFEAESRGIDTGNLTLPARPRGIEARIQVDGQRRHSIANLYIFGGAFQGAATT